MSIFDRFFSLCKPKESNSELEYPVAVQHDGIKLKPERMVIDQLYHCIFDNKVFLFYKDEQELLHCYEVEHPSAVKEISSNPSDIENILKKYSQT
jgi:hypothetical protein